MEEAVELFCLLDGFQRTCMSLSLYILTLLLKTFSHGHPLTKILHTISSALGELIRNPNCPETPEWSLHASAVPNLGLHRMLGRAKCLYQDKSIALWLFRIMNACSPSVQTPGRNDAEWGPTWMRKVVKTHTLALTIKVAKQHFAPQRSEAV